ncbi:MAG: NADH-dependent [FeFe] hydrogenase, group A6 [Bacteroidales bacterium]|nr:NADH-dependent [FeFe] hydrogenase, group A6 [Bacteroidales bacterium]
MIKEVKLKINNIEVCVPEGSTILQAAKKLNIELPTLCYHNDLSVAGNCRVCIVEVKNSRLLQPACVFPVSEGIEVFTNSNLVRQARKHIIELLLSEHNADCTECYRNNNCELQRLAYEYGVSQHLFIDLIPLKNYEKDYSSPSIIKDDSRCIRCQRCVRTCEELQAVSALTVAYRGEHMKISTFFENPMFEIVCTNCGQCVLHCPTGALIERTYIDEVWEAINDPDKHVVVQTAPAVRVALGELFGYEPGERVTGKMVTALKLLGFDSVLDTNFSADLTIIEESNELLERLKKAIKEKQKAYLPMFTSCSPGWIKFAEHMYPELLPHLSTCKSPQQMFGALVKTYYAKKIGIDPKKIVSVSIMPCTAKKFEANRPEMKSSGYRDVDYVLTTRELALMIKQAGINFSKLSETNYDNIMGKSTGAGVIFGVTGGVAEAALRTAYEIITGKEIPFPKLNIIPVRGLEGVREVTIKIDGTLPEWDFLEGMELRVAIAHGLANAKRLIEKILSGQVNYHFVEIMACPGGCLGGGGQPIPVNTEIRKSRVKAIYEEDENMPLRKSHENPDVIALYNEFLHKPLGHKSHELLHVTYTPRKRY